MFFPELEVQRFHTLIADKQNVKLHGHEFPEFSYVRQGRMEHISGGKKAVIGENERGALSARFDKEV